VADNVSGIFKKLNLKDESEILVLEAPESFQTELKALKGVKIVGKLSEAKAFNFALVFATEKAVVDRLSKSLAAKATGDAVLWFAYPKGTSNRLKCDFNRDNGWEVIRGAGWDTVRQVAIDEDWSALRFRRQEFINHRSQKQPPGPSRPLS
jgi:hypothetical protein